MSVHGVCEWCLCMVSAWCLCMVSVHSLLATRGGDLSGSQVRDVSCTFPFPLRRPLQQAVQTGQTKAASLHAAMIPFLGLFFKKKRMSGFRAWRAAGTVQRYVHKTQVRYRPSSASLPAVPAQWPQELARVVFSRREKQQQNLPELRPARQLASRAHCKVRDGRSLSSSGHAAERNIFDGDEDEGTVRR